jgi:hypothetical protein
MWPHFARPVFFNRRHEETMRNTTITIAITAGLMLGTALTAQAQPAADPGMFVSISGGGQFQSRTFQGTSTFTLFNEPGLVTANQTVGSGFVFDASVGYRVWRRLSAAIGVSTFRGTGTAAAIVQVPDPLRVGQPGIKTLSASDYGDLSQVTTAVNFQVVWIRPLTDKLDLWLFIGPSIIRVSQEVAAATETPDPTAAIQNESETTAKAGTVGVDVSYRLNDRYSAGIFVRYAGGEVDLPSVPKLKIGGAQAGGGVRIRF